MDPGLLDVLHHPSDVDLGPVAHGVDVHFDRPLEEPVDQQRRRRQVELGPGATEHAVEVPAQLVLVGDDPHRPASEHERGAHQDRVADGSGHRRRLLHRVGGTERRLRNVE